MYWSGLTMMTHPAIHQMRIIDRSTVKVNTESFVSLTVTLQVTLIIHKDLSSSFVCQMNLKSLSPYHNRREDTEWRESESVPLLSSVNDVSSTLAPLFSPVIFHPSNKYPDDSPESKV